MSQLEALSDINRYNASLRQKGEHDLFDLGRFIESIRLVIKTYMQSSQYQNVLHASLRQAAPSRSNGRAAHSIFENDRAPSHKRTDLEIFRRIKNPDKFFTEDNIILWRKTIRDIDKQLSQPASADTDDAFAAQRAQYNITTNLYHAYLLMADLKYLHIHLFNLMSRIQNIDAKAAEAVYDKLVSYLSVYGQALTQLSKHLQPMLTHPPAQPYFRNCLEPLISLNRLIQVYKDFLLQEEEPSLSPDIQFKHVINDFLPLYLQDGSDDDKPELPLEEMRRQVIERGFIALSLKQCFNLFRMMEIFSQTFKGGATYQINETVTNTIEEFVAQSLVDITKLVILSGTEQKAAMLVRQLNQSMEDEDWYIRRKYIGPTLVFISRYLLDPIKAGWDEVAICLSRIVSDPPETMTSDTLAKVRAILTPPAEAGSQMNDHSPPLSLISAGTSDLISGAIEASSHLFSKEKIRLMIQQIKKPKSEISAETRGVLKRLIADLYAGCELQDIQQIHPHYKPERHSALNMT